MVIFNQMNEIILKYSKYLHNKHNSMTFDVVECNNVYYCGINLFNHFLSYISGYGDFNVIIVHNLDLAYKIFELAEI